jgi:hypothetical protein
MIYILPKETLSEQLKLDSGNLSHVASSRRSPKALSPKALFFVGFWKMYFLFEGPSIRHVVNCGLPKGEILWTTFRQKEKKKRGL